MEITVMYLKSCRCHRGFDIGKASVILEP